MESKLNLTFAEIAFDSENHSYTKDGKRLISVTQIMANNGLAPDYSGASEAVLNKRAEYGTAIHSEIENETDSEAYQQFKTLTKEIGECVYHEVMVSDYEHIAGTIDCIFKDCSLAEIKTTTTLHKVAVQWQLSIYKYLLEFLNPDITVPHLYAIHMPQGKEGKIVEFKPIPKKEIEDLIAFDGFYTYQPNVMPIEEINKALALLETLEKQRQKVKELESKLKEFDERLLASMVENGVQKWETKSVTYTVVAESERKSVDSKKLKENYPDIYDECIKTSKTKAYLKTTCHFSE